ncbi:MAG: DUF4145 domain-containing protein [Candidatus Nitrosoglobus sp.]|jgi:hypothetical protein
MEYDDPLSMKAVLVECCVCHNPLFGYSELVQTDMDSFEWGELKRWWPPQESEVDWDIPEVARISLVEAKICFKAKAYAACVVMCGRTLEGVCKHHNLKIKNLAKGLKKLKEQELIDSRLFE